MKTFRILLVFFIALPVLLSAQDGGESDLLIGISPGMAMRWQQGTMRTTDGYYDCCSFTGGSGIGFSAGFNVLIPLGSAVYLRGGLGWEGVVSDYTAERKSYPILGQGNTVEYADLQNDLSVSMSAVRVDAGLAYMVIEPGLFISVGPCVTVPMSPSWKQTEQMTGPEGLLYLDGSRRKVLIDVDIPGTQPFVSLRFGAGALIPVSSTVHIMPEMVFAVPLMEIQPDYRWSMSGLDLSLGLMFGL
ncbi:MAG: hypothetical protein IH600_07035 [Bacteroidetes bacterium]|nr:hypothetical protein [Bacteroidota bacterium]